MRRKLQVFVSSTFTDLRDERQAAVETILKAGHIPAGMELFAAGDRKQLQVIRQWIEESDVYMLILGGRYGSIDPDSKKSYTHLEYEYAVALGKPLFAIVISDSALMSKKGTPAYEVGNVDSYYAFRSQVLERISRFFDDTKDIRLGIHESLGDLVHSREVAGGGVSAREIAEPKPLIDEIARLTEENVRLKSSLAALEAKARDALDGEERLASIESALRSVSLDYPKRLWPPEQRAKVRAEGKVTLNLFEYFKLFGETLVAGVANSSDADPLVLWIFFDLAPRFAAFGLMERKARGSKRADLYKTTPLGDVFYRRILLNGAEPKASKDTTSSNHDAIYGLQRVADEVASAPTKEEPLTLSGRAKKPGGARKPR